jgi:hypothetical protein
MGILPTLFVLAYVAGIIGIFTVPIAIWRGMKAQERMADSMERIEEFIRSREEERV